MTGVQTCALPICFELGKLDIVAIRERMVSNLTQVDSTLAARVADGLGMTLPPPPKGAANVPRTAKPDTDPALSMAKKSRKYTIVGRKVAVLVATGVDATGVNAVRKALEGGGATVKLLAPRLGDLIDSDGKPMAVDHSLPTVSSVLFDAVFVAGGKASATALCADANAVLFVKEAYKHGKAIAASGDGAMLVTRAARSAGAPDDQFQGPGVLLASASAVGDEFVKRFVAAIALHRFAERKDLAAIIA